MKARLDERPDPATFGRGLGTGLGINLLVSDMAAAIAFQTGALGAEIVWQEADFAILQGCGATWMLHADRAYRDHALGRAVAGLLARRRRGTQALWLRSGSGGGADRGSRRQRPLCAARQATRAAGSLSN
jgi:catechol 2,3-dioxygenase-like lactoylglutathione lyase family enzyme